MFNFLSTTKRVDKLRKEVQDSFENVKEDIGKVGDWIKHIDVKAEGHRGDMDTLKSDVEELKILVEELKNQVSFVNPTIKQAMSRPVQTNADKQTNIVDVQTVVQTGVQTGNLDQLTMMERAIVFVLINNDKRLSYEDISIMLGKKKSTIRGQINTIKQKIPGLVEEARELNGKKRLYVSPENRDILLKSVKVRVNGDKKLVKK
jgi:hypothetical protein